MSLSSLSVRRRITFAMVFIGVLGVGLFGLSQLGVDLYPDIQFPMIFIMSQLEGAGPEEMENLVTDPLEQAVARVRNVKKVTSTSSPGMTAVIAEFAWGSDLYRAETDIRRMLEMYEDFLPEDATDPFVLALDPSAQPVVFIAFTSETLNDYDLRTLVEEEIEPLFTRLEGVGSVMTQGGLVRQIRVEIDPVRLAANELSITQIVQALGSIRNDQPAGDVDTGGMKINVRVESAFHSVEEVEQLVIGYHRGRPVLLRDVADIYDGEKEQIEYVRLNGEPSVIMLAMRRSDANTVNVCDVVYKELSKISRTYKDRLTPTVIFNQADFIHDSIGNLSSTGVQAFFVAIVVLLFFLGSFRSSIIVGISIPMSVVATFAAMYAFDVDINMISLAGLALAVGMLVDNSIVVLESIFRHREKGASASEAAVSGAREVAMAITASTLTTLAVFVPILFVPGMAGQLFRDMSLTISFSLLVSLFVGLSLVPLLTSRMEKLVGEHRPGSVGHRVGASVKRLERRYFTAVTWAVHHRRLVIVSAAMLLVVSLLLLRFVPTEFIPDNDDGFLRIELSRSVGINLSETNSTLHAVEDSIKVLVNPEDLVAIYSRVGESEGIAALFASSASNEGMILVRLTRASQRDTGLDEYKDRIRMLLEAIPDLEYSLSQQGPFGATAPIEIRIYGDDLMELQEFAEMLKGRLFAIEGTREIRSSLEEMIPELTFRPDPAVLSFHGMTPSRLARELTYGLQGTAASFYREGAQEYDIFVRFPKSVRDSREDVEYATVFGSPLSSFGVLSERLSPNTITRINQNRAVMVTCATAGRALGSVVSDVESMLEDIDTRGFRIEIGGQAKDQKETFKYLFLAIAVAAALVYMVMASQFESLLEPFIIILTVPMAFIGVVWILLLTGTTLSVIALIGVLMLAGIVVNNGIVMVDYANQLRRRGLDVLDAITEASAVRMRPIVMTAATTALAMVPLALGMGEGSESWAPMARTVIGGLVAATGLTLFVEPCLYVVLGSRKRFFVAEGREVGDRGNG